MKRNVQNIFNFSLVLLLWGAARQAPGATPAERMIASTYTNTKGESLRYRIYTPEAAEGPVPLIVFLHGSGERGTDNKAQLHHAVPDILKYLDSTSKKAIVLAPQCKPGKKWVEVDWGASAHQTPAVPSEDLGLTREVIDRLLQEGKVDPQRLYITGLSMGGYGTWDAIVRWPDLFAAAAPVCGGGDVTQAMRIKDVPIWAFHGGADTTVPVARSRKMVEAIQAAGGAPKYTEYPGVGHNSWTATYQNTAFLDWMFDQHQTP